MLNVNQCINYYIIKNDKQLRQTYTDTLLATHRRHKYQVTAWSNTYGNTKWTNILHNWRTSGDMRTCLNDSTQCRFNNSFTLLHCNVATERVIHKYFFFKVQCCASVVPIALACFSQITYNHLQSGVIFRITVERKSM